MHNLTLPLNVKQCSRVRQREVAEIRDLLPVPNSRSGLLSLSPRLHRVEYAAFHPRDECFVRIAASLMIHGDLERGLALPVPLDERSFSRRDILSRDRSVTNEPGVAARYCVHDRADFAFRCHLLSLDSHRLIRDRFQRGQFPGNPRFSPAMPE